MAEKIPFFTFFESFVPPRELRLLLHDARVVGGLLDRENRSMELELESGEEFSEAARSALEQLLQKEYDLRRLTLHIRSAAQAAAKVSNDVLFGKEIKGKIVSMEGLNPKMGNIVVEGKVFASECYETRRPGVWWGVLGVAAGLPLTAIVCALLLADSQFSRVMGDIAAWLSENILKEVWLLLGRMVIIIPVALYLFGLLFAARRPHFPEKTDEQRDARAVCRRCMPQFRVSNWVFRTWRSCICCTAPTFVMLLSYR